MFQLPPISNTEQDEMISGTYREGINDQLLLKVQQHLTDYEAYKLARIRQRQKHISKQIDTQVKSSLKELDYIDEDADFKHQRLIDACVKDILKEQPEDIQPDRYARRSEYTHLSIPNNQKHQMKRLSSSIIVDKLIQWKGIQKKNSVEERDNKLMQAVFKTQPSTDQRTLPTIKTMRPSIKVIIPRKQDRAISQLSPIQLNFDTIYESSPKIESNARIERLSNSLKCDSSPKIFDQSPVTKKNILHQSKLQLIIHQINGEKELITSQQRSLRLSQYLNTKRYDEVAIMAKSRYETFQYLKGKLLTK